MPIYTDPTKRHDFIFLFDVTDGNPNGDPDAGNLPRVDPETMHGLVTDVSVKRKIRDYVSILRHNQERFRIFIESKGAALNDKIDASRIANNGSANSEAPTKSGGKADRDAKRAEKDNKRRQEEERRNWMCEQYYDVRTFGAVMSTGDYPAGQVRGPVQLTFSRSIDPIAPLDLAITRVAITKAEDDKVTEIGRKALLPYALYLGRGFITPHFAADTGFDADDLTLFWEALVRCWELDRSASRGMLALRGLYIFSHENALGNAPAHQLFDRLHVEHVPTARSFREYAVAIHEANMPAGVTLTKLVG
jgi:CRISPR-associated protein Csd2